MDFQGILISQKWLWSTLEILFETDTLPSPTLFLWGSNLRKIGPTAPLYWWAETSVQPSRSLLFSMSQQALKRKELEIRKLSDPYLFFQVVGFLAYVLLSIYFLQAPTFLLQPNAGALLVQNNPVANHRNTLNCLLLNQTVDHLAQYCLRSSGNGSSGFQVEKALSTHCYLRLEKGVGGSQSTVSI